LTDSEAERLLRQARAGDGESLAALCEEFYPKVLRYMHYRVDRGSAEDLTAEVFVRVVGHIAEQKGSFQAWLYRIAANVVVDHARSGKSRREAPMDRRTTETAAGDGDDPADVVGRRLDLRGALARLTPEQRELLTLKFIQGLSNEEVAEITGRRHGAIRALQFRALSAMRRLLGGEEGEEPGDA